jgi:CRISPR/Cas system-associated exonuclease Cas4 (RecB family)
MKKEDDPIHIDQFKKQFGNIYYKNLSAIDIIGMETRSPGDLEPLFTTSLDHAVKTFYTLNATKWKPLIVDKTIEVNIGQYKVSDNIDAVLENKNGTSSIEIMKFSSSKIKNIDDMFIKNNFHLNFGRHVLRTILDAKENRISMVYPYKAYRQVISKPDDEYYKRFLDITEHTCDNIKKGYYPAFVNKFKCDTCAYKAVCDNYRERI